MQIHQFRAMNSDIMLAAEGDPERVAEGFQAAEAYIESCEHRFTRFSTDSELSQLNRSAGSWYRTSPDLFELVEQAQLYYHKTEGLFDPSILPDLIRAGYDRSMDDLRRRDLDPRPVTAIKIGRSPFEQVQLDEATLAIHLPYGMQIDLGGLAKGWIAEQAARMLSGYASACGVSAGGDMFLIGHPQYQPVWEVALEDPRTPENDLALLQVGEGAVATSSVAKRVWKQGDVVRHHLIDPRSGEPADSTWLSVTVVAQVAAEAEAFAKAILIAGPGQAQLFVDQNPQIAYLAVDEGGQIWGSPNSKEYLYVDQ
jgi:thiamine biosynthesis lipoprotein